MLALVDQISDRGHFPETREGLVRTYSLVNQGTQGFLLQQTVNQAPCMTMSRNLKEDKKVSEVFGIDEIYGAAKETFRIPVVVQDLLMEDQDMGPPRVH